MFQPNCGQHSLPFRYSLFDRFSERQCRPRTPLASPGILANQRGETERSLSLDGVEVEAASVNARSAPPSCDHRPCRLGKGGEPSDHRQPTKPLSKLLAV